MSARRTVVVGAAAVAIVIGAAEVACRFVFGLGDPPIYVRAPKIDYMLKPDATYLRFGNRVTVDRFGMRSREPAATKGACEVRVLAVGDSVVNGGTLTDQSEIATTLLESRLAAKLGRPVWVGNASNGGWAPENMLAYLDQFGWHSPDIVVLVLNTHDVAQRAAFADHLGPQMPTERPSLALLEIVQRYLPRISRFVSGKSPAAGGGQYAVPDSEAEKILERLIDEAKRQAGVVIVVHNRESDEATQADRNAMRKALSDRLQDIAASSGIHYVDFGPVQHEPTLSKSPYRDDIHINSFGQSLLATTIENKIVAHIGGILERQPPHCNGRSFVQ